MFTIKNYKSYLITTLFILTLTFLALWKISVSQSNAIPSGWKFYKNDVLGISFYYLPEWGEPLTLPSKITDLSKYVQKSEDSDNYPIYYDDYDYYDCAECEIEAKQQSDLSYLDSVDILFTEGGPIIKLYSNEYKGKLCPDQKIYSYYGVSAGRSFLPIDNFLEIKKSGNVCNYKTFPKINYDLRPSCRNDQVTIVYSKCNDKLKTYITQEKEPCEIGDGCETDPDLCRMCTESNFNLYKYKLKSIFLTKLNNGYFDNVLVNYLYNTTFTPINNLKPENILNENINHQEEEKKFTIFVKTIKAIKPISLPTVHPQITGNKKLRTTTTKQISSPKKIFQTIKDEDPNITIIRKYYFAITEGNLQKAYNMLRDKTSLETYKEWYRNIIIMAEPFEFKKLNDNTYQFKVKTQEYDVKEPVLYRVTMKIDKEKIVPISSEEITMIGPSFKDMNIFEIQKGLEKILILSKNGKEQIIDKITMTVPGNDFCGPAGIEFSPSGKYLIYCNYYIEEGPSRSIYIYDILKLNKKKVVEFGWEDEINFTQDEKYLIDCSSDGGVYSVPNFKKIYRLKKALENIGLKDRIRCEPYCDMDMTCDYDEKNQIVSFDIEYFEGENNFENENNKKRKEVQVEFSPVTKNEKIIKK